MYMWAEVWAVLILIAQNPSGQRQNRTADPLFFR